MRRPNETAAIANDIADNLRPWKKGRDRAEISDLVVLQIESFKNASDHHLNRDAVRRTRDNARDILKTIDRLDRQIKDSSPEMKLRLGARTAVLVPLRRECEAAIRSSLADGRKDQVKEWAVKLAGILTLKFSAKMSGSRFRYIAGRLFESVTGEPADLKRNCETELRHIRLLAL